MRFTSKIKLAHDSFDEVKLRFLIYPQIHDKGTDSFYASSLVE